MALTGPQVIVLATPAFFLLIGIEYAIGRWRGRNTYRLNDTLNSIGLGVMSQLVGVLSAAVTFGIYVLAWQHLAPWKLPVDAWWVWVGALIAYDFFYYWQHRLGHTVALFWAAHVVHHQSEDYNLGTALRQTSSNWVAGWVFYLPMALAGVPPLVFGTVALIDLLYQYWVHTQQIGKLGAFDRWFCAPSNHRVHHAVNDRYLDKNYGGIFMLWDHLFGSYKTEDDDEPCVYGTRKPLRSWNPLWANLEVYADLWHDARHAERWTDKLRVWFKPPGWRPPDVARRFPRPDFRLEEVRRYDPPLARGRLVAAVLVFILVANGATFWLWHAHEWTWPLQAAAASLLLVGLWLVGWLTTPGRRRAVAV